VSENDTPADPGWRELGKQPRRPQEALSRRLNVDGSPVVTSFVRLARTHAFHAAGDATYAVALVGSIFALDTDAARGRILLYLVLTLAPFALVGPFIGPFLDRMQGGRRLMIIITLAARGLLMIVLIRNIETFWLFPIAFTQLVMGKTYSVAKAATVPTTVTSHDELVDKNARLAVLGTVAGAVGAVPALGLQAIWGSSLTLSYAFVVYGIGVFMGLALPRVVVDDPQEPDEALDMRGAGVRLAATAMSVLRAISGFVFWLMVFAYGSNDIDLDGIGKAAGVAVRHAMGFSIEGDNSQPAWKLGFVLAAIGLGIFIGNVVAPRLRLRFTEEHMIVGALGAVLLAAVAALWAGGLSAAVLLALIVGIAPASAKLAFDSLVQRDAPGANHGAAFGRFETRFQIASVIGSVIAVAPTVIIPVRVGAFIVALAALAAALLYFVGSRGTATGRLFMRPSKPPQERSRDAQPAGGVVQSGGGQGQWSAPPTQQVAAVAPSGAVAGPPAPALHEHPPAVLPPEPMTPQPATPPRFDPRSWHGDSAQDFRDAPVDDAPIDEIPTVPGAADPYGEAFADEPVEPPDWASAVFGEKPASDPMLPPQWLDGYAGEPTPPLGTPKVE